jgi:hypothetical protein
MAEDRRGFRFSCNASAEVAPHGAPNATLAARATELSLHGCYVETPAPFAVHASVLVKIFHADEYFESNATVAYVKPTSGMGLTFRDVKPYCQGILQKWILAALREQSASEGHRD